VLTHYLFSFSKSFSRLARPTPSDLLASECGQNKTNKGFLEVKTKQKIDKHFWANEQKTATLLLESKPNF
jgi:hypothetical protein